MSGWELYERGQDDRSSFSKRHLVVMACHFNMKSNVGEHHNLQEQLAIQANLGMISPSSKAWKQARKCLIGELIIFNVGEAILSVTSHCI